MVASTFTTILSLALAVRAAPALPVAPHNNAAVVVHGKASFSLKTILNPSFVRRQGESELLKAYAKYNLKPTKQINKAFVNKLQSRQDGTAEANDYQSYAYVVPTNIGGQTLYLDFDTGSSDLWVFSDKLSESARSGHSYFKPALSKTWKALTGYTWDISYGDGSSSSGTVGTDTVSVGDTEVVGQAVEIASKVSASFTSFTDCDGLLGLGFDSLNTVSPKAQSTFFENVKGSLTKPILGTYLPNGTDGSFDFGYTDKTKYTGSITYVSVDTTHGWWEFPSLSYKVGSKSYTAASGATAIADTGTTLLLMTDDVVDTYYKAVSGATYSSEAGGYIFACDATLPALTVAVGSQSAVIPGEQLNFGDSGVDSKCYGGLQSVGTGLGSIQIFGDIFFHEFYSVFDKTTDAERFGFAKLA